MSTPKEDGEKMRREASERKEEQREGGGLVGVRFERAKIEIRRERERAKLFNMYHMQLT